MGSGPEGAAMASHVGLLFEILQDLGNEELKQFQWFLRQPGIVDGFPGIPKSELEEADRQDTVDLMVQTCGLPAALSVTVEVLKKISRNDLVETLSKSASKTNNVAADVAGTPEITGASVTSAAQAEDLLVPRPKPPRHITWYQQKLQSNLHNKFMCTPEGTSKQKDKKLLDEIYTELYIIDGNDVDVNRQHEVRHIEMTSRKLEETKRPILHNDIFKHPSGESTPVRTVLTNGIAGIGKTFLVYKFILDWAERRANQDVHLIFPFTFRQLNLLSRRRFRLAQLIHGCIRESRDITEEALDYIFTNLQASGNTNYDKSKFKLLFVLDGLDESRLELDFSEKEERSVNEPLLVSELLANLIKGRLLPSARLWVTTRPAAANQIPLDCVDIMTEVRGFTDPQKEEYFRKRFSNEEQAARILSHIRMSRSLHIMCHIPVFCWITASVLKQIFEKDERKEIPQTLTEMYTKFLVFQIKQMEQKYEKKNVSVIQSLAKLAFHELERGNLIFYETDLRDSGIRLSEASVYSGVFTQIFKEEDGLNEDKMFCFVHLSIHEYLAALSVILSVINDERDVVAKAQKPFQKLQQFFKKPSVTEVCMKAVDKALQSPSGHLDLFLRFLLGLSLKSNQDLLHGLLKEKESRADCQKVLVTYIKKKIRENPSPERCINLFHCLSELKDSSLVEEVRHYLRTGSLSAAHLSPAQWSALVFVLLSSDEDLDVFDLKKYSRSEEVLLRMLPLVKASTTARLDQCQLSLKSCVALASVLSSSSVKSLDLSFNKLEDSGVLSLSEGLEPPHWKLETLKLSGCGLKEWSGAAFASVLSIKTSSIKYQDQSDGGKKIEVKQILRSSKLEPGEEDDEQLRRFSWITEGRFRNVGEYCSLTDLDLSLNNLNDYGLQLLCDGLKSPHCRLESLRLSLCNLTHRGCKYLASVLSSKPSSLKKLDLSNNALWSSGVQLLCDGLESPNCALETLGLSGCLITEEGFAALASALSSNPSHLRELDLSYNHPGEVGMMLLSAGLDNPAWKLEILRIDHSGETKFLPGPQQYACELKLDPNTVNDRFTLSEGDRQVMNVMQEQMYPDHPDRFEFRNQVLCTTGLTGRCYWEVEWKGEVSVGVSYRGIGRKGQQNDSLLGLNDQSWCFDCNKNTAWHDSECTVCSTAPASRFLRVGVFLDWPAGTLSFYYVSSNTMTHLHTFLCTFTEPVYPALRVFGTYSYALLC
ncbi:NACHT, LRR and PYD domains-containing protein 3-like isoform X1 [Cheilinus undulatus]|uniref:NACHT, LRR and PYD domains-containing protein 3-like isoform X1 n=2 Tax=Cheilinus undulatus TaxID=241271 RepID=UPI001BD3B805|nr:NACHT, LRR and PYD domains-containing protein 3-like isoform X1 [Cheilinus undulatus]